MIKKILHLILGSKKTDNYIKNFARRIHGKEILEIGSGKKVNNEYPYSFKDMFDDSNKFIQSDINPDFGHNVIDINKIKFKNKFDVILCASVLEHDFYFQKAVDNIYNALKKNGTVIVTVPALYPLHDEPNDYWRFTEHSLKILFKKFKEVKIYRTGFRKLPFLYILDAKK